MTICLYHLKWTSPARWVLAGLLLLAATRVFADGSERIPQKKLSRKKVAELADLYVSAVEDRDFETWRTLLHPLHTDSPLLTRSHFKEEALKIDSLSVKKIDGMTAALEIEYQNGREVRGFLQITPSGHIKYTPVVFLHPVRRAAELVQILLNDFVTIMGANSSAALRTQVVKELDALGVPLLKYDPLASSDIERRTAAREILDWLEVNGETYDNTEPFILIETEEFEQSINKALSAGL